MSNQGNEFQREEMFGHPKGLFILFFTEMWERFSFYGMRAILILFIVAPMLKGGLGWTATEALGLYGWYTMLVYVMGIPGGFLADRVFGQKKAVMVGGLLIILGHGALMLPAELAFYAGLALITLGVGSLKPNISTLVGGLYAPGDVRRDQGFTIFYIGINMGAFMSSILVPIFAAKFGWRYGFGLAGAGMLLGQIVYILGQRHLAGIGDLKPVAKVSGSTKEVPLTAIEKDRVLVMLISFLIIIVFWGAFEQAGGLLNLYAQDKIDRNLFSWEIPAGVFQSVNAFFIIALGTVVGGFWVNHALKGRESSTLFKMSLGTMIMGLGFGAMIIASMEASANGKAAMIWLILAYLLHTVGELCASPTALSFITKLAPAKYASLMMGVYFAATGLGNKVAGEIGEIAQSEPVVIVAKAANLDAGVMKDSLAAGAQEYIADVLVYNNGSSVSMVQKSDKIDFAPKVDVKAESRHELKTLLEKYPNSASAPLDGAVTMRKQESGDYEGTLIIAKAQNDREYNTFVFITVFTVVFGALILLFLGKLKALTHGAEDIKK